MGEQVDPFSFLDQWEGSTHSPMASFGRCPSELRTTSLATAQPVPISPSRAVCLPRNSALGLQTCPADGGANLPCLHGTSPVLQEALGGEQPHGHSGQFLLLCMELCWGRRLRQKVATRMEGGNSGRNHPG